MAKSQKKAIFGELEKKVHRQNGSGRCGLAAIRSCLHYQFGIFVTEERAVNEIGNFDNYRNKTITAADIEKWLGMKGVKPRELCAYERKLLLIHKYGVSPNVMAAYLKKKSGQSIKVVASSEGCYKDLDKVIRESWPDIKIFPIIHQMVKYDDDDELDGHYMMFCGTRRYNGKTKVRLFDPSFTHSGFKEYSPREFMRNWKGNGGDERWFMLAVPESVKLDQKFRGRYL